MAYLILIRHGQSEYNANGWWTGWDNPPLTETGVTEAKKAGEELKELPIDIAYVSDLIRARQTLEEITKVLGKTDIETIESPEIKERNYGIYTKKNKWEIKEQVGDDEFMSIRRSWDHPIPEGESLKQVYDRAIPYFELHILPQLKENKNVLIVSSGNSLRALVKRLENIPNDQVAALEITTGEIYVYQVDESGEVVSKEIKNANAVHA